jgi:hypothetical protein
MALSLMGGRGGPEIDWRIAKDRAVAILNKWGDKQ